MLIFAFSGSVCQLRQRVPVGNRGLCTVSVSCCFMTRFTIGQRSAVACQVYLIDQSVIYMAHNVLLMIRVVAKLHRSPTTPANFNISQHPLIILVPELDPAIKQATDVSNV